MYRFKYHKNASRGIGCEVLTAPRIVYMRFDTWRTLFYADPDNWTYCEHKGIFPNRDPYWLPAYRIPNKDRSCGWSYKYIKFLTARDYRKFRRFIKNRLKNGEDTENTKKLIELTELVRERVNKRLEDALAQTKKALEENKEQVEAANERLKLFYTTH